jgi:hypothetical protein
MKKTLFVTFLGAVFFLQNFLQLPAPAEMS